jgi:hypothetical protein
MDPVQVSYSAFGNAAMRGAVERVKRGDDGDSDGSDAVVIAGKRSVDRNLPVCALCFDGGELLCCDGPCMRSFHYTCLGLTQKQVRLVACRVSRVACRFFTSPLFVSDAILFHRFALLRCCVRSKRSRSLQTAPGRATTVDTNATCARRV